MALFGQHESPDMLKNSLNNPSTKVNWWRAVCRPTTSAQISNVIDYGNLHELSPYSAIDQYFSNTQKLIVFGKQPLLDENYEIANLLFVGVISHTENYFRELFSKLLCLCPTSQAKSSGRDIKLGSVIWFRTGQLERGAFEGFSFASSDNIIDTIKKYFDLALDSKSDSHELLDQFDRLCELRHAIVHAGGVMSGKNALKLQFQPTKKNVYVQMDFQKFQEVSSICTALICSLNSELFKHFAMRWRNDWPKRDPSWNIKKQNKSFQDLWKIFHSNTDYQRGAIAIALSQKKCREEILKP